VNNRKKPRDLTQNKGMVLRVTLEEAEDVVAIEVDSVDQIMME
jgi:hypothetical protein